MIQVQVLGAGECGLPLAHRLLGGGASVTLVTDRSAAEVLSGTVTSTQVKFSSTLDLEWDAGLGFWHSQAPQIKGIRFNLVLDRNVVAGWAGHFSATAQSVDQRTVFARWLTEFSAAGGTLEIDELSVPALDRRAAEYDLTVVSRASRELAAYFPIDPAWELPAEPLRRLAVLYLDNVQPDPDELGLYVALPGLGEMISYPALTGEPGSERRCEILMFEAQPMGELDVFTSHSSATQRLRQALELLERYLPPAIADRFRAAELTDAGATLTGAVPPTMRRPVGTLPSGIPILGGGDVVCRMDPGGAQGANNAVHCGFRYADAILNNQVTYDHAWMTEVAARWLTEIAHPAARWTMAVLDPPAPMQQAMLAAQQDVTLADTFADIFAHPAQMSRFAGAT